MSEKQNVSFQQYIQHPSRATTQLSHRIVQDMSRNSRLPVVSLYASRFHAEHMNAMHDSNTPSTPNAQAYRSGRAPGSMEVDTLSDKASQRKERTIRHTGRGGGRSSDREGSANLWKNPSTLSLVLTKKSATEPTELIRKLLTTSH